jgi:hypothetical protein
MSRSFGSLPASSTKTCSISLRAEPLFAASTCWRAVLRALRFRSLASTGRRSRGHWRTRWRTRRSTHTYVKCRALHATARPLSVKRLARRRQRGARRWPLGCKSTNARQPRHAGRIERVEIRITTVIRSGQTRRGNLGLSPLFGYPVARGRERFASSLFRLRDSLAALPTDEVTEADAIGLAESYQRLLAPVKSLLDDLGVNSGEFDGQHPAAAGRPMPLADPMHSWGRASKTERSVGPDGGNTPPSDRWICGRPDSNRSAESEAHGGAIEAARQAAKPPVGLSSVTGHGSSPAPQIVLLAAALRVLEGIDTLLGDLTTRRTNRQQTMTG